MIVLILLFGTIVFYKSKSQTQKAVLNQDILRKKSQDNNLSIIKKEIEKNSSQPFNKNKIKINKHIPKQEKTTQEEPKQKETTLLKALSMDEAILTTQARKNIKPISAIRIVNNGLSTLHKEDTLLLPNIDGNDYKITIVHTQKNRNGSSSLTGKLEDENIGYTTTITQSEQSTFVTLSTPQGLYEIETQNGVGYVYDTKDIRKQLHRNHESDVIMLPIPNINTSP